MNRNATTSTRRSSAAATALLAGPTALCLALSACGGGGSAEAGATVDAASATSGAEYAGSVYLKTRNTVLYRGRATGLSREAIQLGVDLCNANRATFYGLAPLSPPEDVMASLDVSVHEKYLEINKALTRITRTTLQLTDHDRWARELGDFSRRVPPDCSVVRVIEGKSATLWRDGLRYDLRYDTLTANGGPAPRSTAALLTPAEFGALPFDLVLGQSCRIVTAPPAAGFATGSSSCIWDALPNAPYLNWPFALKGEVSFGLGAAGLVETIEPLALERGRAIPAAVFEIPTGFTIRRAVEAAR